MIDLRTSYFDALRQSQSRQKQLVSKSALGPQIYAIRNEAGEVVGFAPGERLSPDEIAALKTDVAKSADGDPNDVFDDFFNFGESLTATIGGEPVNARIEDVQKSADVDDDSLVGIFPLWMQQ